LMSETMLGYQAMAGRLFERLPKVAVLVIDEFFQCLFANQAARALVSCFSSGKRTSESGAALTDDHIRDFCKGHFKGLLHGDVKCDKQFELVHPVTKIRVQGKISLFSVPGMRSLLVISMESEDPAGPVNDKLKAHRLTGREIEVASLVCLGFSNAVIASKLFISEGTVENHLLSIYDKMGVNNRTGLVCRIHGLSQTDS
jgi:DNA-binding CsgD family transcriptional regulator